MSSEALKALSNAFVAHEKKCCDMGGKIDVCPEEVEQESKVRLYGFFPRTTKGVIIGGMYVRVKYQSKHLINVTLPSDIKGEVMVQLMPRLTWVRGAQTRGMKKRNNDQIQWHRTNAKKLRVVARSGERCERDDASERDSESDRGLSDVSSSSIVDGSVSSTNTFDYTSGDPHPAPPRARLTAENIRAHIERKL